MRTIVLLTSLANMGIELNNTPFIVTTKNGKKPLENAAEAGTQGEKLEMKIVRVFV